ncbi:hypothetical protein CONPUDRAFT_162837 [Coniophora puteana RWD-64-598 SS2]|uniref:DUF7770 domain-containing protein n=1 Tax=Coniophora puteana (strain RWD-64-598) TaxID=741705 RepID=A0A5M3N3V3_CONPW|nr:uncharacterized protein CONPUDRAFT_162837 [Coniophora puteana RWD-64-598 SS2]EIW85694.1 hypothetical protein CONPUDRAFT_162837 [Coniophora puteana RWD-64-598 SS2]
MTARTYPKTINTANLAKEDEQRIVSEFVVTTLQANTNADNPNIFHWKIFLTLAEPEVSANSKRRYAVLDMVPTGMNCAWTFMDGHPKQDVTSWTGTLMVSSEQVSTASLCDGPIHVDLSITPSKNFTVPDVLGLLLDSHMDRYNFNAHGMGCLHWIMITMERLQDTGLVEAQALKRLQAFHAKQLELHPGRHPFPIAKGEFYD